VIGLGYLMPEARWREWAVTEANAATVASEMVQAVSSYATPYLVQLSNDRASLSSAVQRSPAYANAHGLCRACLVLAHDGRPDQARSLAAQRQAALGDRTDAAAEAERRMIARLLERLLSSGHHSS
jgi:hypothetical protein